MPVDTGKELDKIQNLFMIKLRKTKIKGNFNLIKNIYYPTANIISNSERLKASPQCSGIRQICPLSSLLFDTVLEF